MPKPSQLSSCDVGLDGLDAKSVEQGVRPDMVVDGVMHVDPAHGAHGPMVECSEHVYHLRSQAPVLGTEEEYGEHQAVVHTPLGLDRDVFALEEAVLECTEGPK
jgi:hypothetical protein